MKTKKLRRSLKESIVGGVSGGLGEYFDTDPVIFRILFVVLSLTGGGGIFIYLLMWIFIPKADAVFEAHNTSQNSSGTEEQKEPFNTQEEKAKTTEGEPAFNPLTDEEGEKGEKTKSKFNGNLLGGAILITVGSFFLFDDFFPWFDWDYLWPVALIIAGLAIIKINYNKKK